MFGVDKRDREDEQWKVGQMYIYIYIHTQIYTYIYIYRFMDRDRERERERERGINNIDDRRLARAASHAFVHAHTNV